MSYEQTILKGTTSKIIEVVLRDSTTGAGKTGVAHGDVTASYVREGGTRTAVTLTAGTAGDAYSSGKWCEVDSTNCPGLYQLHLPNAALATGVDAVTTTLTATGVIDKMVRISLLDVDLRDAADAGLSNLDAAVSTRSTVAATDIVSGGAITTSGGAVSNVTLVATTTTNSDMRGTDSSFLAASAPANFGSLLINSSGHVTRVTLVDTTTSNTDMVDVSGLATSAELSTVDANVDAILVDTGTTIPASISALNDLSANDVWDASLSSHNVAGSTGKALKQIKEGVISTDGSVDDTSATATTFISNLSETTDGFYHDKVIVFISGDLLGQARHIETYVGATKSITVSQGFTAAPSDGDEFLILATYEHSLNEISEAVWSDTHSSYTTDGTFGYYLDASVSSAGAGGTGLYQVTVTVQNEDGDVLQGARVNVDGTTLTLVTNSSGVCVFSLDSGVYTLHVSPPAGYQTPTGNVITVATADISSTFTLEATAPSGDCDVPWVG